MKILTPITEQFEHFVEDFKEDLGGDLYTQTRNPRKQLKQFLEAELARERDRYCGLQWIERAPEA